MSLVNGFKKSVLLLTVLFLILSLGGCGAKQNRRVTPSGFLNDYSKLKTGKGNEALYVYVNPKADCRKYHKVMIDRVTLWAKAKDSPLALLDSKDKKMLATLGWGTLYDAMHKGHFEIVDKPGPDVMRVRGAITEAKHAIVFLADAIMLVPYVWEAATLWSIGSGKWPFLGELAGDIELSDSVSGERLFMAVDKVVGTLGSNMDPWAKWSDVRQGFERWREQSTASGWRVVARQGHLPCPPTNAVSSKSRMITFLPNLIHG